MRLLHYNGDGEFSVTQFFDKIPRYAILSHTWGLEEVTFKDIIEGNGTSKAGFNKIRFCGEQARRDGLQYFWVDTCCIDKSSSAELTEAINSMFRWYHESTKCYVYLSDVSRPAADRDDLAWEAAFRISKWFTRGWTLQELIAPTLVEFFSEEGELLGDKSTLEGYICEIARLPSKALRGSPLSDFSIISRMSWAERRETTREEDQAYSLLGIFNIYMPLIYGEGRENAFKRLQEEIDKPSKGLDRLPSAADAPFNSYNKQLAPTCLPDTRVDLLQEIYDWADRQDERCIFWLNGLAGTGKSTIALTVAHRYFDQKRLGASFFFSRGGGDVSHAGKFFTSFAVQLARNTPQIQQLISNAILEQNDIANRSLRDQWRQLVLYPLSRLDGSFSPSSYILIVDALDECNSEDDIRMILQLLTEARTLKTVRLRVFLTSRPEIPIRHGFCRIPEAEHEVFMLHNISPVIINHDVSIFLEYNLEAIRQERTLEAGWPGEQVIRRLVENASGLFIWAATACRFIREGKKRLAIKDRLSSTLRSNGSVTGPEKHLNEIYITVLRHSIPTAFSDKEKEDFYTKLRYMLGSIVALLSPLSTLSLSTLLHISEEDIDETLEDLHAILDIPNDPTYPLRLHHPSFRDFLLNKDRCGDFWVDEKEAHQILTTSCIQLMLQTLKKDICEMHAPGSQATQVESSRIQKYLLPEVQYACLYWVQHLQRGGSQVCDGEEVHRFLQAHLLHWLEALGWMGKTSEGIQAILSLEAYILVDESPNLHAFIYDAKRFALYNRLAIERTPLQLYCSALLFSPEKSIVRQMFQSYIPPWIQRKPRVQAHWSSTLQTLEGHLGDVTSVAFSPDGKLVASGSNDRTVRLWDASTGALLQTLEGHSSWVTSVAFSPDGKLLASGAAVQNFWGHCVTFSPGRKLVASDLDDRMLRLWDLCTAATLQPLESSSVAFSLDGKLLASGLLSREIMSVAFSPDGKLLASGLLDRTVQFWDTGTGTLLQTLEGHSGSVSSIAFSPDGKLLASGSRDRTVRLWDATTGVSLQTLDGYSDAVTSVTFSLDGKLLASGSADGTVQLWDASRGAPLQLLEGHSGEVSSVAFSPDGKLLVSGSYHDETVRLLDAGTGAPLRPLEGHSECVRSIAFSPNGKLLASGSRDGTVRLWDADTGLLLQPSEGHSGAVWSVTFSPDGKLVASSSLGDTKVRLWDTGTGTLLQTLEGHSGALRYVAFSPDGKLLASGTSDDKTVRLWDTCTGAPLQILEGHSGTIWSLSFSPDGKLMASGSSDGIVQLWDAGTMVSLQTLEGHLSEVTSIAFSPDGKLMASGSTDDTVRLWDAGTGALLQMLEGHSGEVYSVAFSPDGKYLKTDGSLQELDPSIAILSDWSEPLQTLFISDQWIMEGDEWVIEGGENILWLPPDYRPYCKAIWNGTIVLGLSSGSFCFLELAQGSKLI